MKLSRPEALSIAEAWQGTADFYSTAAYCIQRIAEADLDIPPPLLRLMGNVAQADRTPAEAVLGDCSGPENGAHAYGPEPVRLTGVSIESDRHGIVLSGEAVLSRETPSEDIDHGPPKTPCPDCHGCGYYECVAYYDGRAECPTCKGAGVVGEDEL